MLTFIFLPILLMIAFITILTHLNVGNLLKALNKKQADGKTCASIASGKTSVDYSVAKFETADKKTIDNTSYCNTPNPTSDTFDECCCITSCLSDKSTPAPTPSSCKSKCSSFAPKLMK